MRQLLTHSLSFPTVHVYGDNNDTDSQAMDNSPTSLFDSYEQDYEQIIKSIREKLDADGDQRIGIGLYNSSSFSTMSLTSPNTHSQNSAKLPCAE